MQRRKAGTSEIILPFKLFIKRCSILLYCTRKSAPCTVSVASISRCRKVPHRRLIPRHEIFTYYCAGVASNMVFPSTALCMPAATASTLSDPTSPILRMRTAHGRDPAASQCMLMFMQKELKKNTEETGENGNSESCCSSACAQNAHVWAHDMA
jgi:hypothetical protein